MSNDVIQAQYEKLAAIAADFGRGLGTAAELEKRVRQSAQEVQQGWEGQAATAFQGEMANTVLPALQRLSAALAAGNQAVQRAAGTLRAAEELAAEPFRGHGSAAAAGGAAASAAAAAGAKAAAAQGGHDKTAEALPAGRIAGDRAGLDPAFAAKLDRMAARMKALGYDVKVAEGRRTLDQQVEHYTRGRTFEQFKTGLLQEVKHHHIGAQEAQKWIDYYDPTKGKHPMTPGFTEPVTKTLASEHLSGRGADVVDPVHGWNMPKAYWDALHRSAEAEGLEAPISWDKAHIQLKHTRG